MGGKKQTKRKNTGYSGRRTGNRKKQTGVCSNRRGGNSRKYRKRPERKRYHGQGLFSVVMLCYLSLFVYGFYVTEVQSGLPDSYIKEEQAEKPEHSTPMEVHFLDVGQSDATLIICDGEAMLIDAGEEDQGTAIQYYLMKQGIEELDYLVLTHPDSDHIGSADVIITKFEIGKVIMSYYEKENDTYRNLLEALKYKNLKAQTALVGDTFSVGSAECTILGPVKEYEDPNNASVVLLVQHGKNRFLFTGDAEETAEADLLESADGFSLQADVYKAGHHGSNTSSAESFLDAVDPDWAVISCGKDNSYGHPHAEVMERLAERNVLVYRTDEQGTVVAVSDGQQISWKRN